MISSSYTSARTQLSSCACARARAREIIEEFPPTRPDQHLSMRRISASTARLGLYNVSLAWLAAHPVCPNIEHHPMYDTCVRRSDLAPATKCPLAGAFHCDGSIENSPKRFG